MLYILALGALPTTELHPSIQETFAGPLCDDSVELVIDGQYFGKRWSSTLFKNAQQYLNCTGQIVFRREALGVDIVTLIDSRRHASFLNYRTICRS